MCTFQGFEREKVAWKNRSLGISDDQTRHVDCRRGRDNLRRYIRSGASGFLPEGPNTGSGPGNIDWNDGEKREIIRKDIIF